ncbi:hypothetical protein PPROV_000668700 [Pycnococcus provasolii]|uniref:PsbP C-terminal domain-containing protein n=1 Tax=Pycnococcus provasolii TaxID=41880 RepID=A0A830HMV1_9CHLO|nr:hypothetical protein PPROV_000668700 [Pycnococcus provasolii]
MSAPCRTTAAPSRGRRRAVVAVACSHHSRRSSLLASIYISSNLLSPSPSFARPPPVQPAPASVVSSDLFSFTAPVGFRVAANRPSSSSSPASFLGTSSSGETLAIATDLRRFAVISVRTEPYPEALRNLILQTSSNESSATPSAEQISRAITQPLADAVVFGTTDSVAGVVNGESGTVAFNLLDAQATNVQNCAAPAIKYEYVVEVCRGKIDATQGLDGKAMCLSPRDDGPLPTIRRRNRCVTVLRADQTLLTIRASAEDRAWDDQLDADTASALASFQCTL